MADLDSVEIVGGSAERQSRRDDRMMFSDRPVRSSPHRQTLNRISTKLRRIQLPDPRLHMMVTLSTPFSDPIWRGLARETDLAAQLICSGANEIGRADYASQGRYAAAQFGFSNGLERLGKLILTSDSLLSRGQPLDDKELRGKGHSILGIVDAVAKVQSERQLELGYERPTSRIAANALASFDNFAAASQGRYANHASLTGVPSPHEPTARWWTSVCEPILDEHFRGTKLEKRARADSQQVGVMLANSSVTLHFHENGSVITNVAEASFMAHERKATQKWGRFYSLGYARWMSELFTELTRGVGYTPSTEFFFGHYERLATFRVPDNFLKNRATWPLR
ncbi:hypothetical protein G6020_16145 [Dietzia sp. B19]|uniref:hypothetical protein n=2 Tax=Dietzia TaxID=37914 RepID=UPI0015F81FBB|nr:hypothetical protein [Dietzia sp. B19]MBB1058865.1 hypothetical protein [Dietzia sp. B19]